jgi:hypothetical protein
VILGDNWDTFWMCRFLYGRVELQDRRAGLNDYRVMVRLLLAGKQLKRLQKIPWKNGAGLRNYANSVL